MYRSVAVGLSALAGAALLEVALVPALAIGGAAMLAPTLLAKAGEGLRSAADAMARPFTETAAPSDLPAASTEAAKPEFAVKQALAKTVTFRVIVTSLDFTSNFLVIGEFATAAGLSAFSLVAGPVFYFVHETAWNRLGPPTGEPVALAIRLRDTSEAGGGQRRIVVGRALAKTITFRTIATVMDFTTNFVVVGDVATAAALAAFGFVLGPFVYLGHEAAWEYFTKPRSDAPAPQPVALPA